MSNPVVNGQVVVNGPRLKSVSVIAVAVIAGTVTMRILALLSLLFLLLGVRRRRVGDVKRAGWGVVRVHSGRRIGTKGRSSGRGVMLVGRSLGGTLASELGGQRNNNQPLLQGCSIGLGRVF